MLSNGVIYEYNKSSVNDLFIHLSAVDNDYAVRLSDRTDIKEYAQKLFEKSERIEAWENDVLVGLVAYYNNQVTNSVYVSDVSVKKKFRSYGIASNLLNRLKDNVIKNNITKIVLEADDSLGDFYVKNGFTIGKRISDRSHEMEYYKDDKDIMVSICCLVYNHEPYLRQCFEGFVMQKTTFPIEILVHDDASTDYSADIIREYTEKYPHLFKPIYQTENQYSKGVKITMTYQIPRAKGKYIAMCEGDDYWTDPMKLQKQVEFLEGHEEYVLSFHDVKTIDTEGNTIAESKMKLYYSEKMCRDWSDFDLMCGYTPFTPTVVYRREVRAKVGREMYKAKGLINGDTIVASLIGKYGKGKFHNDIQNSVCRVQRGGIWQMKSVLYKLINSYKTFTFLESMHKKNKDVKEYIFNFRVRLLERIIRLNIEDGNYKGFIYYYLILLKMLFAKFNIKAMYNVSKDVGHWLKVRKKS